MKAWTVVWLGLWPLGCVAPGDATIGRTRAAIIGGEPDSGDPAVVALKAGFATPYCTGTLVAPGVVLTAAHCAVMEDKKILVPSSVNVTGDAPTQTAASWVEVFPHFDITTYSGDLALVGLASMLPVDPVPLNTTTMTSDWQNMPARFVGFGYRQPGPSGGVGDKYQVVSPLGEIADQKFTYGEVTCSGDSGGPAFVTVNGTEVLAGVTSTGPPGCYFYGRSTRVDAYGEWLASRMSAAGADCGADGRCRADCADVDPDCLCVPDGICSACANGVDPDCRAVGDACDSDSQCVDSLCVSGVCRAHCDSASQCSAGFSCSSDEGSVCLPAPPAGCSMSTGAPPSGALVLLLVAVMFARRRRQKPMQHPEGKS